MIAEESIVRPVEGVVFRRLSQGQGGVVLHLETGAYHGLNETGAILWELMEREGAIRDVARAFADMIDDAPDRLPEDVSSFFSSLEARGLVTIRPG